VLALAGNPPYTEKPHTAMRRVIARRLAESKQTVPHFYMSIDCGIDELLKTRAALNAKSDKYRISVNDFVVRAAALALRQVPAANASWSDEAILLWERVDISVAVALDDGRTTTRRTGDVMLVDGSWRVTLDTFCRWELAPSCGAALEQRADDALSPALRHR